MKSIRTLLTLCAVATLAVSTGCGKSDSTATAPKTAPLAATPTAKTATGSAAAAKTPAAPKKLAPAEIKSAAARSKATRNAIRSRKVSVDGVSFKAPLGWRTEIPKSQMRVAQYRLPRAKGDTADGEVSVIAAGGTVEANIARWKGQFEGTPVLKRKDHEVNGKTITWVELEGTFLYKERMMAPGPGKKLENYIVRGIIIPGRRGHVFVKGWGPKNTMTEQRDRFGELMKSVAASKVK